MKIKYRQYKVYYFVGDFYGSQGETRKSVTIRARNEDDAEHIFKVTYPDKNFGWVEDCQDSRY